MNMIPAFVKLDSCMAQAQAIYRVYDPQQQRIPIDYILAHMSRAIADNIVSNGFYELTTRKTADIMPVEEHRMTVRVFPNGSPAIKVLKSEYQKLQDRIAELENEVMLLKCKAKEEL
jgi:hypothetical protein